MTQLFRDIPNEEYHDNADLSRSDGITILQAGPATAKYNKEHKEETYSPALRFGTMFHTAMESLDEFRRKYGIEADGDRRTRAYKDAMVALHAKHPDKEFVKQEEWDAVSEMSNRICTHPRYKELVGKDNIREASFFGSVNGVSIKARPDLINLTDGIIVDWKTTSDGSPQEFAYSVSKFGYWLQPAWYKALVEDYFNREFRFVFVCVEKHPPYNVSLYEQSDIEERYAKKQMAIALDAWAHAKETGEWTAYSEDIVTMPPRRFVVEQMGGL